MISNLAEYALGGDPTTNAVTTPNGEAISPSILVNDSDPYFDYHRRLDYIDRALTYAIEYSDDLSPDRWETLEQESIDQLTITESGFEKVRVPIVTEDLDRRFYRLRITLDE